MDVSRNRVQKIRDNIANHSSTLRDVFVSIVDPLSSVALEGIESTSGTVPETTTALSVTFSFVCSTLPISMDDYEIAHAEDQGNVGADVDPFPNVDDAELIISYASVTSYGPSYFGPSFPVSSTRLALLSRYTKSPGLKLMLRTLELSYLFIFALLFASRIVACSLLSSSRSRLISRASSFYTKSTSAILSVGMPISAGMTASVPYVNKNEIVLELFSIIRDDFSWEFKSTNDVIPHEFFDLVASDGRHWFCFNPLCEVVNSYNQKFDFSRPFRKRSSDINALLIEWPRRCDWA
ncbi:hypothetical protein Tco_1245733 [Tanacetum coccineum]